MLAKRRLIARPCFGKHLCGKGELNHMVRTTGKSGGAPRRQNSTSFAVMAAGAAILFAAAAAPSARAQDQTPPYWASVNQPEAIMRRGPSTEMRAMWNYRRVDLPLKVIAVHDDWRQVQDPGGITGWMHRRLLTGRRTAIVIDDVQAMRTSPEANAPVAYRAEPGVVGRITDCSNGWCMFDVRGQAGWISTDGIWGDEPL